MAGSQLEESFLTHLSTIEFSLITSTLENKDNIELKIWEYVYQVYKLLSDFRGLRHDILSELFNNTTTHFMEVKLGTLDQSMSKGYTEHGTEE